MSVFKIQKIRSCVQCGDILSKKCDRCVKHPDREPKIWTYYEWPPILAVCPCRCSVQIRCQREGCTGERWVNKTHSRGGLARFEKLYCSRNCHLLVLAASRREKRIKATCAWESCRKAIDRRPSEVKRSARSFCRPDHYYLWIAEKRHAEAEQRRQKLQEEKKAEECRAMLHCETCDDVVEHEVLGPRGARARCRQCATERTASTTPSVLLGVAHGTQGLTVLSK